MKKTLLFLCLLGLVAGRGTAQDTPIDVVAGTELPPVLTADASAASVLKAARDMLPAGRVELSGALILRNRRGIVSKEFGYRLALNHSDEVTQMTVRLTPRGETNLLSSATVTRRPGARPIMRLEPPSATAPSLLDRVLETDVTWLDLTFDFLWWTSAEYETAREGETVHGQTCLVVFARPPAPVEGLSGVRLWVDKKTGCLLQAEQVDDKGKPIRRLWGTRIKKFGDRWMASVLEVETLGARHRTKITVEDLVCD